jgi:hypothetical protein
MSTGEKDKSFSTLDETSPQISRADSFLPGLEWSTPQVDPSDDMSFNGYNIINRETGFYLDLAFGDGAQGTAILAQTQGSNTLNQQVGIYSTFDRSPIDNTDFRTNSGESSPSMRATACILSRTCKPIHLPPRMGTASWFVRFALFVFILPTCFNRMEASLVTSYPCLGKSSPLVAGFKATALSCTCALHRITV